MIKYRHYYTGRLEVEKRYGIALYVHPKRKALDIYFGSHVFVWFVGRAY